MAHSADSLHVHATTDGYCYLHGERLTVAGFQQFPEEVVGGYHTFEQGVIFFDAITDAEIVAEEFIAVQGEVKNCTLRSKGDILLQNAENCIIVTAGTVYVDGDLINCDIKTRQKVVGSPYSRIMGGTVRAFREITAGSVGTSDFIETTLEVGNDHYTPLRDIEIEQEMVGCNYNILRIQSALKPFSSSAAHRNLTDERRALIQQIQSHQKVQEDRIRLLREEKRRNVLLTKERVTATITVVETHPGVWIRNGRLQLLVETPMQHVQFVEAQRGTTLLAVPLENAT